MHTCLCTMIYNTVWGIICDYNVGVNITNISSDQISYKLPNIIFE